MYRVHLRTFGCQMNERDSEAVSALLRARGYRLVDTPEEADVVLLNTCSVRDQAEQRALARLSEIAGRRRGRATSVLGILGCMAQNRGAELLDRLPDLDLIVGTQKFHQVPDHLDRLLAEQAQRTGMLRPARRPIVDLEAEEGSQNEIRHHEPRAGRVTAFVSIQQGCNMDCSFCIVPRTRGDERSRPMEAIVEECAALAAEGVREVTLLGQIVTSYGRRDYRHTGGRTPFVQLLEKVAAVPGLARIRFTSPHPRGFREDLVEAYRSLPQLMPQVHLPLQSGSDRILRAMNRPYTRDVYLRIVDQLRAARPDVHLSTDIIVGFPGETEEDFAATAELFERVGYDMAYIFKYSLRTGTVAAELPDPCGEVEKEVRQQRLLRLLEESSGRRAAALVGTVQEVLVEGPSRPNATARRLGRGESPLVAGRTPGGRLVHLPGGPEHIGALLPVRIVHATTAALHGERVPADAPVEVAA